jgi:hypothetical protein
MISKLGDAQRRLISSVDAMERLLVCKIDRAEVPMLDAATEKMNALLEFRDDASTRCTSCLLVALPSSSISRSPPLSPVFSLPLARTHTTTGSGVWSA